MASAGLARVTLGLPGDAREMPDASTPIRSPNSSAAKYFMCGMQPAAPSWPATLPELPHLLQTVGYQAHCYPDQRGKPGE